VGATALVGATLSHVQRIEIEHDFAVPVDRAFAYLSEHENLGPLFGAQVTRVRDGETSRNGVGSVRSLKVGPLPAFDETVTALVPNERIEYRITRGGPLRSHHAVMSLSPNGTGSHLRYVIEFGAVVPGLDRVVKAMLVRSITANLSAVDANA